MLSTAASRACALQRNEVRHTTSFEGLRTVGAALCFFVAVAFTVSFGCGKSTDSSQSATNSAALVAGATVAPPRQEFFRAISGDSIPDKSIVAHIPPATSFIDREVIRRVMAALPPRLRQDLIWLHVPPGKPGYKDLPNKGLIVMYCDKCPEGSGLPGLFVLYFDGKVQLDSNLIYESHLDGYLTVVPHGFDFDVLRQLPK